MKEPITIRLPAEMNAKIEALRARRLDRPAKGQVVRELIAKALGSEK